MSKLKIMLGGVPFGCNNIGDEAILTQVVHIVKDIVPMASLVVSTGDAKNTASLLNVETCPLYSAFSQNEDNQSFFSAMNTADVFIWAGATGLSDYPDAALDCLDEAQQRGLKTVVFCTGMNDTFNPAHFKLGNGPRRKLYRVLHGATFGQLDLIARYETEKESNVRKRLKSVLDDCDLVVNRDSQSRHQLMKSKLKKPPIVAADPAITLPLIPVNEKIWGHKLMACLESNAIKIGVCVSSQQPITQLIQFANWLDKIIVQHNAQIIFIPMNPITDYQVMSEIQIEMKQRNSTLIAEGSVDPSAIAGLTSNVDIVISSRLHLLIFAAISNTLCIGIGRGSKVSNFLSEFGYCTAGTTEDINFEYLSKEVSKLLQKKSTFCEIGTLVRQAMLMRLDKGKQELKSCLTLRQAPEVDTQSVFGR
jgi:polysaccharide pyruvyl transferase WcaK-like protein